MATMKPAPVFGAIEKHLKTLCLNGFPCGNGSWREPEPPSHQKRKVFKRSHLKCVIQEKKKPDDSDLETIKMLAQKEKSEALQELVDSQFSPWYLDCSWSEEAKELRDMAVKSPRRIDANFVFNYFKTLRIVDSDVTEVDSNLLKLKNLEELTLSANYITKVNSKNLPPSLKVLELCANKISDISTLCICPPLLHHLGLGHNKIYFIGQYITGDYWQDLMSLDLSYNDLCDLMDTAMRLGTLPKLRNLILQGNPLSLVPSYRGYIIDYLSCLHALDDIHISADEKFNFKGLSERKEFILNEANVQIGIKYLKGLPCPEEIKNHNTQSTLVEKAYFVQFMFPNEKRMIVSEVVTDNQATMTSFDVTEGQEQESKEMEKSLSITKSTDQSPIQSKVLIQRNVLLENQLRTKNSEINSGPSEKAKSGDILDSGQQQNEDDRKTEDSEITPQVELMPITTEPQPWAEEFELNWSKDLVRSDLLALKNFFKNGMDFSVVEQVVLLSPAESEKTSEGGKDAKDKKKGGKGKEGGKEKDKEKRKTKNLSAVPLLRSPPIFNTVAAFHITLETFLEGGHEYHNIFTKVDVPPSSAIKSMDEVTKKSDKGMRKSVNKSPTEKKKDEKKSLRDGKESDKGKKAGKGKQQTEESEVEDILHLEMDVTVKLHYWVTAMDPVKEEEERTRKLESIATEIKSSQTSNPLSSASADLVTT